MKLERSKNFDQLKIDEAQPRIEKLEKNYVNVFRTKNPDLKHMGNEEMICYNQLLVKQSQNLRKPYSTILVIGGVLLIFLGTLSLSIMIARVFYKKQLSGNHANSENFLYQEKHLLTIGFESMIDKLASIAGSIVAVLMFKPAIYGYTRSQQQTSCVYNVETISSSIIAGISSIAGASGQVEIHIAFIIGYIGGIIYLFGSQILDKF